MRTSSSLPSIDDRVLPAFSAGRPSRPKVSPGRNVAAQFATNLKRQFRPIQSKLRLLRRQIVSNPSAPICVQCMTRRNAEIILRRFHPIPSQNGTPRLAGRLSVSPLAFQATPRSLSTAVPFAESIPLIPALSPGTPIKFVTQSPVCRPLRLKNRHSHVRALSTTRTNTELTLRHATYCLSSQNHQASDAICLIARTLLQSPPTIQVATTSALSRLLT